jgi:uncharacterized repeat protein (TIGR03803 family)
MALVPYYFFARKTLVTFLAFSSMLLASVRSIAQVPCPYADLHDFEGTITYSGGTTGPDGNGPSGSVMKDSAGNIYGTTGLGGAQGKGILWEITAAGVYKDLHDFGGTITYGDSASGADGEEPAGLVIDSSGNFWGTAGYGGENNKGIVWELSMTGVYKDIHDFGLLTITTSNGSSGSDGFTPSTAPSIDRNGNLFGTTAFGGAKNIGILWEITAAGDYKDLHDFGGTVTLANGGHGPDGQEPTTPVTVDSSGDLFGVATLGGPYRSQEFGDACGMVYEFTSAGVYKDLHDFGATITNSQGQQAQDGAQPSCQVALDSSGNVYGTTAYPFLVQNIWKITSTGAYIDLYDFTTSITYPDGTSGQATGFPWGAVALDKLGNIYGASARGGEFYGGNVWELLKGGSYIDLHEFGGPVTYANGTTGTDPVTPESGATLDANGNVCRRSNRCPLFE